jgi:hypothetical protein
VNAATVVGKRVGCEQQTVSQLGRGVLKC